MRVLPCVLVLALATACASQPSTDRPMVSGPDSVRPDGTVPDGLAEMRGTLADQRAEARQRENALLINRNALQPQSPPWYDSVLNTLADAVHSALSIGSLLY